MSFLMNRRLVLSGSAIALLAGRDALAAAEKSANPANDVAILNSALGAELEAIEAYSVGAGSGLLKGPVLASERTKVLSAIRAVTGVHGIDDDLQTRDRDEGFWPRHGPRTFIS